MIPIALADVMLAVLIVLVAAAYLDGRQHR